MTILHENKEIVKRMTAFFKEKKYRKIPSKQQKRLYLYIETIRQSVENGRKKNFSKK